MGAATSSPASSSSSSSSSALPRAVAAAGDGESAAAAAAVAAAAASAAALAESAAASRAADLGAQLLEACASRRAADALRLLAAGGANLDVRDAAGRSALMLASEDETGELDRVAARLIASGAGLDFADENDGSTALVKACAKRRVTTALLLVRAGAELDAVDVGEEEHMTALDYACARGLGDVAQAIHGNRGRSFKQIKAAHEDELAAAARWKGGDVATLRQARNATVAKKEEAAEATLRAVAAAVVVAARNAVARDAAELEAAKAAASEIAARAEAAARARVSSYRGPAADSALGERFLDIIALVSANGFALDARPTRYLCGLTFRLGARRADGSLDRAGYNGAPADMIKWSLRLQAPWVEAARRAPRKSSRTSLMVAASGGSVQRVRELLAAGAPLACVDDSKRTALHFACAAGDKRCVEMLLEADVAGVTINAQTRAGTTPLLTASSARHEHAVRALLARGARQDLVDEDNYAALHMAGKRGHSNIAALLCAAPGGAGELLSMYTNGDVLPCGNGPAFLRGDSALDLAKKGGKEMCAAVLRACGALE